MTFGGIWRAICWTLALALAACARMATEPAPEAPLWDKREALALIAGVERIAADGLDPAAYDLTPLQTAIAADNPDGAENAASALFAEVAEDIRTGIIPPGQRLRWSLPAPDADPAIIAAAGARAAASHRFAETFASLAPQHAQYRALKAALAAHDGAAEDAARLRLNMERWRWAPRDLGPDYILVNVPAYELILVRNGEEIDRRRVVVGARMTPTPQFAATVAAVAFNPTWFVPRSIVAESVGALLANEPEKAQSLGYYVDAGGGVRQRPGPANALGRMKLIMPNPYSVFLHDTPAKSAFARETRALSHGCIRVEDAVGFAKLLLGSTVDDGAVDEILSGQTTQEIPLERPIPVYAAYFTAYPDKDGAAVFYPDIYGLDAPLLEKFGAPAPQDAEAPEPAAPIESCPEEAPAQ